ncbi:hypothetical protein BWR19_10190 [Halomonas sp. 1513]|nr:YjbH domain-containing protein [Halomonas sp. 1513]APX93268.1 hypothetical protein BWR19_10190 [Halomonas sp. 1513]
MGLSLSAGSGLALAAGSVPAQNLGLGKGQSDFGGVGLMQTPTARMAPFGSMSGSFNRTAPYRRYNLFFQPAEWLEGGFRYVQVENRTFTAAGEGTPNLDKGVDAKLRLWNESRYLPALAVGLRDLGGTTLFGAEYLVASKRWHDLDFSLGLGWGYLGNEADLRSPLGVLDSRFDERPGEAGGDQGGEFAVDALFRGSAAVFGGVEYQTPWDRLLLQLEYEGNDYQNEPQDNDQVRDSRVNLGARFKLSDGLELRAGWQRGNTAMAGIAYTTNLAGLSQAKRDPAPAALDAEPQPDWASLAEELELNAGLRATRISQEGQDLIVEGEPTRFRALAQSEGRAGRLLHAQTDDDVQRLRYRWENRGMFLRESVHDRQALVAAAGSAEHETAHKHGIYQHARLTPPAADAETLYEAPTQRLQYSLGPGFQQNFGGPDGYLYRLSAVASAEYATDRNGWFSGTLTYTLADNLDNYEYIADSDLPRVRTFIGDYLAETDLGIDNLQYTRTAQLGRNWYAMGYGGLLEMMYAGVGAELLYRPFNSRWAVGADLNRVQQREFDQRFGLRDYTTTTGHLTAYVETGVEDVLAKVSVGRYLAGDIGTTIDLSREFESGVRVGAWATFTDAGDDFGEGSFDKALYMSLPLDAFFIRSTRDRADIAWQPLTRDGGARLNRRYSLYEVTEERRLNGYWDDYEASWR